MQKKGQATIFIILGIIIVAVVLLLLFLRGQLVLGPTTPENLKTKLVQIQEQIEDIINNVAPTYIEKIGVQGGYLSLPEGTFRKYATHLNILPEKYQEEYKSSSMSISYLCYNIPKKLNCMNRMLLLRNMEGEISSAIKEELLSKLNLENFKGIGYDLIYNPNDMKISTKINPTTVTVSLYYPITIKKDENQDTVSLFSVNFDYPLGNIYDVSQDIINSEAEFGDFDQLVYMLTKKGQFIIYKDRPYPDKLYIIKTKDNPYIFQFFVEGEPS